VKTQNESLKRSLLLDSQPSALLKIKSCMTVKTQNESLKRSLLLDSQPSASKDGSALKSCLSLRKKCYIMTKNSPAVIETACAALNPQTVETDLDSPSIPSSPKTSYGCIKKVGFGTVEVKEYTCILGVNKSCSEGPPISLAYPMKTCIAPIDAYRANQEDYRRAKDQLRIPASVRVDMLLDAEYSPYKIQPATLSVLQGKEHRMLSLSRRWYDPIDERADWLKRRVRRLALK